jgi:phospholipid/cholesterol/gamma-HCH transport system substrate-binding protein
MLKGKLSKLKVGLTVLIGLAIFIFFITVVGIESNLFKKTYTLKFFVTDMEGLANGSMVTLGGLKIGDVKKIEFSQIDGVNGITVTISMPKEYQKMITEKSFASIKGIGMLGDKYVDITMGMPTEKALEDGQFINVAPSFSLERGVKNLEDKVTSTLNNVDSVLMEFKSVTSKINNGDGTVGKLINSSSLYDNLNSVSGKFSKITDAIIEKRGTLGKTIYDDELYRNLQFTTTNIKTITEDLKLGKGTMGKLLTSDSVYSNVKSISEKLDTMMTNINGNSTVGKLLSDDEMYKKFIITIKEFNNLLIDVRKNPKKYINISIF